MPSSPSLLLRRVYYASILAALVAGGAFLAASLRHGWAESSEELALDDYAIVLPADFPSDVAVYTGDKIVTLYGFDFDGERKAHRLKYSLKGSIAFEAIASFYRQKLEQLGWTVQASMGEDYGALNAEKPDALLQITLTTYRGMVTVGVTYTPKGMGTVSQDVDGADMPDDFPVFFPWHPEAELFAYEVRTTDAEDSGDRHYRAFFQVTGAGTSGEELRTFYEEAAAKVGMKPRSPSASHQEFLALTDGQHALDILIRPVSMHVGTRDGIPDYYQITMEASSVAQEASVNTPRHDGGSAASVAKKNGFSDLPNGYGYAPAIRTLETKQILEGYPDGTFKPGNPINRAEFVKMIIVARGDDPEGESCFNDVRNEWFAKYVCHAKQKGIVTGYPDGNFGPGRKVTYAEAIKMAMVAFGKVRWDDPEGWAWYDKYFGAAHRQGYLKQIEFITDDDPNTPINRGQMAQLIANVLGYSSESSGTSTDLVAGRKYTLDGTVVANMDPARTQPDADIFFTIDTLDYGLVKVYYSVVGDPRKVSVNCTSDFFQLAYRLTPGSNVHVVGLGQSPDSLGLCGATDLQLTLGDILQNSVAVEREIRAAITKCQPLTRSIPFALGSKSLVIKGRTDGRCVLEYSEEVEGGYRTYHCSLPEGYDASKGAIPIQDTELCAKSKEGNIFFDSFSG